MNAQQPSGTTTPERHVAGRCMTCGFEGQVIERIVGAGFKITMCARCSSVGQQAIALAQTVRPFLPAAQRFLGGLLNSLMPRR